MSSYPQIFFVPLDAGIHSLGQVSHYETNDKCGWHTQEGNVVADVELTSSPASSSDPIRS